MNREILFKAKIKDNGKWVEGYYCKLDETTYCISEDYERHPVPTHHYILHETMTDWGLPNRFLQFEIDPSTICQCTGLTDKNGKKIWENDILKGCQYPFLFEGKENYYAKVIWFENCPAFGIYTFKNPKSNVRGISEGNTELMESWNSEDWEVIGNVFDNADLLGVE